MMPNLIFTRATTIAAPLATALIALIALPAWASGQHEHTEAKEVAAFHAAIAPLWHAENGPARIVNACKQAATLDKLAQDIKTGKAAALQEVASLFKEKCQTSPAEAEAVFGKLHDAFHKVSEHKE